MLIQTLHPAQALGSSSQLVGQVRVAELLHKLKLHVRLAQVSIHKECFGFDGDSTAKVDAAVDFQSARGVGPGGDERDLLLGHGGHGGWHCGQGCLELELAWLGVGEHPRSTQLESLRQGSHEVKLESIVRLNHGNHFQAHVHFLELRRLPNLLALGFHEHLLDLFWIGRNSRLLVCKDCIEI